MSTSTTVIKKYKKKILKKNLEIPNQVYQDEFLKVYSALVPKILRLKNQIWSKLAINKNLKHYQISYNNP